MACVSDDQSDIVLDRESDTRSHIVSIRSVDSIYWLIAQGAILGWLLASADVQDRARLGWVRKPDGCVCLEFFVGPLRISILASFVALRGSRIAWCCRLDVLYQLPGDRGIECAPFCNRWPANVAGSL